MIDIDVIYFLLSFTSYLPYSLCTALYCLSLFLSAMEFSASVMRLSASERLRMLVVRRSLDDAIAGPT